MTIWSAAAALCVSALCLLVNLGPVQAGGPQRGAGRNIRLLDSHWRIDKLLDFNHWKAAPVLNPTQIAQLHCPWPAGVWKPVQLPDDYIIRW